MVNDRIAAIVALYFLGLLGWNLRNFLRSRKNPAAEEVAYVGHRDFGTAALIATLVAVYASNYTLLAAAESGFRYGLSGAIWYSVGVALPIVLFVWPVNLISRMREAMPRGVTLVEYYGMRYDERTRLAALVTILIASVLVVISVVVAIGILLTSMLHIGTVTASVIGGAVLIVYTALGGYEGTVGSHIFQLMVAGLAVAVSLALATHHINLSHYVSHLGSGQRNVLAWGPSHMLNFSLSLAALAIANPVLWQRMFSAKNDRVAVRAMLGFPLLWIPFALGSGIMGMIAHYVMPNIPPDQAATSLVMRLFPTWAAVLFLLGGLALVFSTGDAVINNIASIFQFDVLDRCFRIRPTGRRAVYLSSGLQIILGIIGIVGALAVKSILHLLVVNSAVNIALVMPLVLGLTWKKANARGAFWSIVAGLAAGAALMLTGHGMMGDLVALVISGLFVLTVSHWWPADSPSQIHAVRPASHAASGAGLALVLYTGLFVLASAFGHLSFFLPGATLYPLMLYAFGGCLILFCVLPVVIWRHRRGKANFGLG